METENTARKVITTFSSLDSCFLKEAPNNEQNIFIESIDSFIEYLTALKKDGNTHIRIDCSDIEIAWEGERDGTYVEKIKVDGYECHIENDKEYNDRMKREEEIRVKLERERNEKIERDKKIKSANERREYERLKAKFEPEN